MIEADRNQQRGHGPLPLRGLIAGRVPELDAIRGIAALIVVFFHCWKTLPWPQYSLLHGDVVATGGLAAWEVLFKLTPLRVITAGTASVGVFFILSGLVLAFPFVNGRRDTYRDFLIKRFFRLYPPFVAAILISAGLCVAVQPQLIAHLSGWFNHSWDEPVTKDLIAGHLAMLGLDRYEHLDNVMWSLVHEVRISIVFPLIAYVTLRSPRTSLMPAVLLLCGLSTPTAIGFIRTALVTGNGAWPLATLLDTARYLIYFVGGILLATRFDQLVNANKCARPLTRVILWITAFSLLLSNIGPFGDAAWAAGASILIISCMGSSRARGALQTAPAQWLGKVSYSLYLIHVPLLLTIIHLLQGTRFQLAAILFVPAISLAAAEIFYRCVERPSHRLGRRFGGGEAVSREGWRGIGISTDIARRPTL